MRKILFSFLSVHHDSRIVEDNLYQLELPDEGNVAHTLLSNLAKELKDKDESRDLYAT